MNCNPSRDLMAYGTRIDPWESLRIDPIMRTDTSFTRVVLRTNSGFFILNDDQVWWKTHDLISHSLSFHIISCEDFDP
ncbi:hypothetical protein TNCV_2063201 [Trichonephila clavipes]|nr:hypothetical protein TNCV_2063201 [Trichonephila clavipes]